MNAFLTEENEIPQEVKKGCTYIIHFDKENDIWMVKLRYKYFMLDGILYEGLVVFVNTDGYVISVLKGV